MRSGALPLRVLTLVDFPILYGCDTRISILALARYVRGRLLRRQASSGMRRSG